MKNIPPEVSEYLRGISSVKGKNKGNQHARKYNTEEERKAARKKSQDAYRERQKVKNNG